jgi:hypothetical protein
LKKCSKIVKIISNMEMYVKVFYSQERTELLT